MSDRKIYCNKCNCNVGLIRDAQLMVGLQYTCTACSAVDFLGNSDSTYDNKSTKDFMDIFNEAIFKK